MLGCLKKTLTFELLPTLSSALTIAAEPDKSNEKLLTELPVVFLKDR